MHKQAKMVNGVDRVASYPLRFKLLSTYRKFQHVLISLIAPAGFWPQRAKTRGGIYSSPRTEYDI